MAITRMRFLQELSWVGRHRRAFCGMTDGIVRCTPMRRPRRARRSPMVGGRLKGSPCLQRADEGHTIVNALGRTSYTPQPQGPPEGFRNPAQSAPESHALGGVLMGAEARECAPKRSPARHVPRAAASSRGQPMSTEDDREKSREESPKWHRARAARLRANGFTKMAEEHEQIAQAIERRRQQQTK
jgi:hypothetical protein